MSKQTLLIIAILLRRLERKKRNKNRKKIFQNRRQQRGEFHVLFYDLTLHDYFSSFMISVLF